jgi:hypothetical protein
MKPPNTIEQEIDRIRLQIYEETKNMTAQERVERINRIGESAAKKFGFKIVASAKEKKQIEPLFKELSEQAKIIRSRIKAETGTIDVLSLIREGRNR